MVTSESLGEERIWEAESLRITTFHKVGAIAPGAAEIWELVTGEKPEQESSRPRESLTVAEGNHEDKVLLVGCRPERVDLNLFPIQPLPNVPRTGFATIGNFLDAVTRFIDLSNTWLQSGPAVARIAFGAVLLLDVPDIPSGNRMMEGLIPDIKLDADGSCDFFYQINRRRESTLMEGVQINRLTKWSVIQGSSIGVAVHGNTEPRATQSPELFACRLELDINTAGLLDNPLSGSEASTLFGELVQLGKEIAVQGDIS